jgi:hypothetical protein
VETLAQRLNDAGYTTTLIYNDLPMEKALERNINRFIETQRLVDPEYHLDNEYKPLQTYLDLRGSDSFDRCETYSNDVERGHEPVRLESLPDNGERVLRLRGSGTAHDTRRVGQKGRGTGENSSRITPQTTEAPEGAFLCHQTAKTCKLWRQSGARTSRQRCGGVTTLRHSMSGKKLTSGNLIAQL